MDGTIFQTTLSQMGSLLLLMTVGFLIRKLNVVKEGAVHTLSCMETYLLIPAICLGTFMKQFTTEKLGTAWKLVLGSLAAEAAVILLSFLLSRLFTKERYSRKVYQYAICFANFGYFGNAIMSAIFPEFFADYLIYTLMLWAGIAAWGAPMLMNRGDSGERLSLKVTLKRLANPMLISMVVGMLIGLSGLQMPAFIGTAVDSLGSCMSPIAMLLSGMIIAEVNLKKTFADAKIYVMTVLRLIVIPLVFLAAARIFAFSEEFTLLGVAAVAMPIGLNTIVIPASNGDVPEEATGMVIVSHVLSMVTIPLLFWLLTVWK